MNLPNVASEETLARLALVSEHSSRWRSLSVEGVLTNDLIVHFEKPTPKLESIFIVADIWRYERPRSIEFGQTGNFRELHLASIGMGWNSPRVSGLKLLRLHSLSRHQTPSVEQLVACLRASPELEVLVLSELAGSAASPTTQPEEIAFQFLSLTTIALYKIPKDILEFVMFSLKAPNCNSLRVWDLAISVLRSTRMVDLLKSSLYRHISLKNTFTLRYNETQGNFVFQDRDCVVLNGWIQDTDPGDASGIVIGFQPVSGTLPGEEIRQLLGNCYPLLCGVLADAFVPQDWFGVTLLLENQRWSDLDPNGLLSFHPCAFPLHLFRHSPFITRITMEGWYKWAPVLNYLSEPQKNLATGEESWVCPRLQFVELVKDLQYVGLGEKEDMDRALDGFLKARSATSALKSVKIEDSRERCTHIWDRDQGWSVIPERVANKSL
ncbi:hypothetical protein FRC01_003201 [Tulasnella sp. 417]|nr:hypothetical protein FRC01_003201 [Tulasnella sp. 417]